MKALFSLVAVAFLIASSGRLAVQNSLPPKPDDRIADYAAVMQIDDRNRLARQLQQQFQKNHISVYVATFQDVTGGDTTVADNLQKAWIAEPQGFVILYNQRRDKLSVSLTPDVSQKFSAPGALQDLDDQIDAINKQGPATSVPLAVNTILNALYPVDDGRQRLLDDADRKAQWSFIIPGLIVLAVMIYGLRLAWLRLKSQNVFERSKPLPVGSAQPKFGSNLGGTSFASVKFRQ